MEKRGDTYELSNLGEVKLPDNLTESQVRLEKLVFTQWYAYLAVILPFLPRAASREPGEEPSGSVGSFLYS